MTQPRPELVCGATERKNSVVVYEGLAAHVDEKCCAVSVIGHVTVNTLIHNNYTDLLLSALYSQNVNTCNTYSVRQHTNLYQHSHKLFLIYDVRFIKVPVLMCPTN